MFAMKYSLFLVFAWSIGFLASCTKENSTVGPDGMVKTIDSVAMDAQIGVIPLDDGNFVVVSNGQLVKLDDRKYGLEKTCAEIRDTCGSCGPGGFVLFGFRLITDAWFFLCLPP
jgi:hypothetical protein